MTIRQHPLLIIAVLLLTSCAHEEVQEISRIISLRLVSDSTEIVQAGNYRYTRADDGINDDGSFIYPADFSVAVDGNNYIYTANAVNTDMTSLSPASYPVNGNSVRLQAFYPSFKMHYATTPQTFTVAYNQSQTSTGNANYRASDLMYGLPQETFTPYIEGSGPNRRVKPSEYAVPLIFEHKMVKIRIDVTTNGATVKGITMKNVKRSIDFNTADATFSHLATAADGLGDIVIMYDHTTGTSADFTCTALIPTQSLAANTPFIDVVIDAQPSDLTYTYKVGNAFDFDAGKQYIYTLSVDMDEVEVSCEITDWNTTPAGWTNITDTLTL